MIKDLINAIIEWINTKTDILQVDRVMEIMGVIAVVLLIIFAIILLCFLVWGIISTLKEKGKK